MRQNMKNLSLAILIALAVVGCRGSDGSLAQQAGGASREEQDSQRESAADEKQFVATLSEFASLRERATAVTLYEVANQFDEGYANLKSNPQIGGYPITRKVHLTRETSLPLVMQLTNRSTYFPAGEAWSCLFEPHHVLELTAGDERALAVICLLCGDVEFIMKGKSIGTHSIPSGKELYRILSGFFPFRAAE